MWDAWIGQRHRWLPTLLLIPGLYGLGWLLMQPIAHLIPTLSQQTRDLSGTLISLLLFLALLPSWVRIRWNSPHPWQQLGVCGGPGQDRRSWAFLRGLGWATVLLLLLVTISSIGSWGRELWELSPANGWNALLLCFGVGIAEELLFRGWLWGELDQLIGPRLALPGQALIFSLAHTRFNLGLWPMVGLLVGLFLFGLTLAIRRRLDRGSLWGCIGLHGGLVGGWFALQSGLMQLSPASPEWLTGPGGNPLGGLVGIIAMAGLLRIQLTAWASAARPSTGARRASSKGAKP